MRKDFTYIYKKYKGLWIALDSKLERVISASRSAEKAYKDAVGKGYKTPTMFKVPKVNLPYFGFSPDR